MANCPKCESELNDDFGIVNCSSCGTVCFVDLDGEVQVQGAESVGGESESFSCEASVSEDLGDDDEGLDHFESEEEVYEEDLVVDTNDYHVEEEAEPGSSEQTYEPQSEESETLEEVLEEEEPLEAVEEPSPVSPPMTGASFLADLEVFTESSEVEDFEHIYYDLKISGLNSTEDQDLLIEHLADSRLEISEETLQESLDKLSGGGALVLPKISLLRLTVIYKRLLDLPFDLDWVKSEEQNASEGSALDEEEEVYSD